MGFTIFFRLLASLKSKDITPIMETYGRIWKSTLQPIAVDMENQQPQNHPPKKQHETV
jgi:hypothetical protein